MTIETIPLNTPEFCLPIEATQAEALRLMLLHGVNHAPVCQDREWVGMISMRDLVGAALPVSARIEHGLDDLAFAGDGAALLRAHILEMGQRKVADLVRRDVPILHRDHSLLEAALLLYQQAMPLPVLGSDGHFLGMLSPRALMKHLSDQAEASNGGKR